MKHDQSCQKKWTVRISNISANCSLREPAFAKQRPTTWKETFRREEAVNILQQITVEKAKWKKLRMAKPLDFTEIISQLILRHTTISEKQQGFRKNCSMVDAVFIVRQMIKKNIEYNKPTYLYSLILPRLLQSTSDGCWGWIESNGNTPKYYKED